MLWRCYLHPSNLDSSAPPSTQQIVVNFKAPVWGGERSRRSSHSSVLDVGAGDGALEWWVWESFDCLGPNTVMLWTVELYVFWGSGEMGPGVLVPSVLNTGIWNWGVRTDGNWNRCPPWRRVAGLSGATGLSVLQKWMLDSRGLGVSNSVGVWGGRYARQARVTFITMWTMKQPWLILANLIDLHVEVQRPFLSCLFGMFAFLFCKARLNTQNPKLKYQCLLSC